VLTTGEGRGKVEGWLRVRFAGLDGVEWLRRWGAPVVSGAGRRGPCGCAAGARRSGQGARQGRMGGGKHARERKAGLYTQALAPDNSGRTAGSCEERTAAQRPKQPRQACVMGKGFTA
jgi:hypothetical protein